MKINREAKRLARKYFGLCREGNSFSEAKARTVVQALANSQPRNLLGILSWFKKLVEIETAKNTAIVESATKLEEKTILDKILSTHGKNMKVIFKTNEALLGGIRIKIGSDVFDGSVRGRLIALERSL